MHFLYSLARERFDQHILRYILCPRWDVSCLATHVEMNSVSMNSGME
jgi:hypothetical protein